MRKRDFSISDDKRISCPSFCSLCVGKKHRFRSLFPFGNLPLKRCFLFFIYDLISRSSIRRTAAFLSPLFSEILRPDRTRSGRCRICGCFQDRSDVSGLRTGRRARSIPSTVHPSQSSEVPDRSVCWRGSRLPLPQFFPGGGWLQNLCDVQMPESGTDLLSNPKHFSAPAHGNSQVRGNW